MKLLQQVRDLESQLAEERKTRMKQENRALASISTQSALSASSNQPQTATSRDTKPPLAPSRLRPPLRRITNFMPVPSPAPSNKKSMSYLPVVNEAKENNNISRENQTKQILKPRRGSIAVRPSQATTSSSHKAFQPKRRASIATFHTESSSKVKTPIRPDRVMGRQSFVWDPQRVWRTSRVSSPLPQSRESSTIEMTPVGPRSSKFRGSPPPSQMGSWKPKHPTVIALQKKHLVWSPLKLKGMKNKRSSLY